MLHNAEPRGECSPETDGASFGEGEKYMINNFFTPPSMAHKLLAKNTSLVETTNKNKQSPPPSAHQKAGMHDTKVMQSNAHYLSGQ